MPASRTWLKTSEAARRLHVSAKTVTRWASEGRLEHRRTLGGHRRYDPELIDALVTALTYRPNPHPALARPEGGLLVARRTTWLIDMGDGTWAVSCMACRIALYRGPKAGADRAARGHYCEPVLPLGRRRRSA